MVKFDLFPIDFQFVTHCKLTIIQVSTLLFLNPMKPIMLLKLSLHIFRHTMHQPQLFHPHTYLIMLQLMLHTHQSYHMLPMLLCLIMHRPMCLIPQFTHTRRQFFITHPFIRTLHCFINNSCERLTHIYVY